MTARVIKPQPPDRDGAWAAQIGALAEAALLREARLTPKPGLVDGHTSGAHRDMDLALLERSAATIRPYFSQFAENGLLSGLPAERQLDALRPIGLAAEHAMLCATGNVNTHKGAIFVLGVLACCCGRLRARGAALSPVNVCAEAGGVCAHVARELADPSLDTHGARCYRRYGVPGVRGEAASGFPSIRAYALSPLRQTALPEDTRLLAALLSLVANVDDTTVLTRAGQEGAAYCKAAARTLLATYPPEQPGFLPAIERLDRDFTDRNISPGGCADLLAAAWFLDRVEREAF